MNLFREMTGAEWNSQDGVELDPETKITEFDFENYLNPNLLKNVDTTAPEFKHLVRLLNFTTKTKYEAH